MLDAYRILMDWPLSRRDIAHKLALNACRAAVSGDVETETARRLFIAFAQRHDIIAPASSDAAVRLRGSSTDRHNHY